MTVSEKLAALRALMEKRKIAAYIIPSDDFHGSEYVGDYFKAREFMSGFTGSAGTLVVTGEGAYLWTDGRYFIQAAEQLENSGVELMKMGEPGVPTITEFLKEKLEDDSCLGFDGRVVSTAFADKLKNSLNNVSFRTDEDLVDMVWKYRPAISAEKVWALSEKYAGSRSEKLERVRRSISEKNCDILLVTAPEEIAWLLGLRGNDVECTPVFLSYMLISADKALLFANESIFGDEIKKSLSAAGVAVLPYFSVYDELKKECIEKSVWADPGRTNFALMTSLDNSKKVIKEVSPIDLMKAVKSESEQEGMRKAHILDGAAMVKFIYWLKKNVGKEKITELSASDKLFGFRKAQPGFVETSFESIVAYGAHAAICHYAPSVESDCEIVPKGLCLVDSGGQYEFGTTDITRTIVVGDLTDDERRMFTLVMKGHLRLGDAVFKYGCGGGAVDYIAREPMWKDSLDYNHGTGHGVGFVLSVHEGPQRIHWNTQNKNVPFEPGMITSNEPGFYAEGKFGVRHENLVLCVDRDNNEYGRFLGFENLTMVPFDIDGLDLRLMDDEEKKLLNDYHRKVRETISPYLDYDEKAWLENATKAI